jgi:hypothetical protein
MSAKSIAFKPVNLTRPAESWVEGKSKPGIAAGATKRLTVDVPADLHKRIKMDCAATGRQISDVVRELLDGKYPAPAQANVTD